MCRFLNISVGTDESSVLAAGAFFRKAMMRDVLAVGSSDRLVVYDVMHNAPLFETDLTDGCSALAFAILPCVSTTVPVLLVGGSCTVTAYDASGEEVYLVAVGGNVTTLSPSISLSSSAVRAAVKWNAVEKAPAEGDVLRGGELPGGMGRSYLGQNDQDGGRFAMSEQLMQSIVKRSEAVGSDLAVGTNDSAIAFVKGRRNLR